MDFNKLNDPGVMVPLARDPALNKPSVTLLLMYVANVLAIISLIILHFKAEATVATSATCIYAVICTVLYMFRQLTKAKFDLDDKSIELDNEEKPNA